MLPLNKIVKLDSCIYDFDFTYFKKVRCRIYIVNFIIDIDAPFDLSPLRASYKPNFFRNGFTEKISNWRFAI